MVGICSITKTILHHETGVSAWSQLPIHTPSPRLDYPLHRWSPSHYTCTGIIQHYERIAADRHFKFLCKPNFHIGSIRENVEIFISHSGAQEHTNYQLNALTFLDWSLDTGIPPQSASIGCAPQPAHRPGGVLGPSSVPCALPSSSGLPSGTVSLHTKASAPPSWLPPAPWETQSV